VDRRAWQFWRLMVVVSLIVAALAVFLVIARVTQR
jgi:anti-sigma-K factor RskA